MTDPLVSVVMGVRNGGDTLEATLDSITSQQGVDLEFVVVNDGSTDGSRALLDRLAARDPRVIVLHRGGSGLTAALIEGCHRARGEFIARQDAGDRSLPGRLERQVTCLREDPAASLCSSAVRNLTQEGAILSEVRIQPEQLRDGLTGPAHHGSVMIRRGAYERAGGYRQQFLYAQDLDLWSRLVEVGGHRVLNDVLYEATLWPGSISGTRRREQQRFHALIVEATRARRSGRPESPWLEKAEALSQLCRSAPRSPGREAHGAYFIGASLAGREPELARRYLQRALELDPWHLRARLRLAQLR